MSLAKTGKRNWLNITSTSHERAAFLRGLLVAMPGNGTAVQRRRIRAALSRGPLSTIEAGEPHRVGAYVLGAKP